MAPLFLFPLRSVQGVEISVESYVDMFHVKQA